jgi:hypothetical protein
MKNRSRATPFMRFFSATFWPAAMLRIALWAGQNVIYSRDVMRNIWHFLLKYFDKSIDNKSKSG